MSYRFNGTLGEWKVLPYYSKIVCDDDRYHNVITICNLSTKGKLKHREKFNPHLIAAAPDLLDACIGILGCTNPLQFHDYLVNIEDAIKKALNVE